MEAFREEISRYFGDRANDNLFFSQLGALRTDARSERASVTNNAPRDVSTGTTNDATRLEKTEAEVNC